MVGIVIVSHSAKLAEGVYELADQMAQGQARIAIAGGIDDAENPIGTDPMRVLAAIESVYSDDGVIVLMDLGSALLSAEMALEFLPPEQQVNVFLLEAPLVEGALAAVVQAVIGGSRAQIMAEARGALAVKAHQLGIELPAAPAPVADVLSASTEEAEAITLHVRNRLGLHARPAARFVSTAARFDAAISVRKGERSASAQSINQVTTLGVRQGDTIVITAVGPEAQAALSALQALANANFGDADDETPPDTPQVAAAPAPQAEAGVLVGIAASPGIAIGPVALYRPRLPEIVTTTVDDPNAEWTRLETAVAAARQEIKALHTQAQQQVGAEEAAIFEAHLLFLQDPALVGAAKAHIFTDRINAEAAWQREIEALAAQYRALEEAYMQARAADVEDVGQRVLRQLLDVELPSLAFETPAILAAADLTPSDTARLDPDRVLGICTELGGATAHSAILARALGIPAVVGLGPLVWTLAEGQTIALNGATGQLWLTPTPAQLAELRAAQAAWQAEQDAAKAASQTTAVTRDGHPIEIVANIGGPHDAPVALEYGAEGVGLFRTEFLFMDRDAAPAEAEQLEAYRKVAAVMGKRPLIIRTLDIGGDKPLSYLDLGPEANPFLGWRGIRFCLDRPAVFKPQLRAILRASVDERGAPYNLKLMFPMIGSVGEIRAARALLAEAQAELRAEGYAFDPNLAVGIMIEVPSAVAVADLLAREVDFFSIGTNDLTQYTMAADRGNTRVAALADALQPAVLRLIDQTVRAAHAAGIWVGICGELAGNALATPLLVGLGLDELSMSAPAIPGVKAAVRGLTRAQAVEIAARALGLDSATAVVDYLKSLT